MLLIISLIIVFLFIYFLKDSLKKHAGIYYIGAAVISIAVFLIGFLPMPLFVKNNILGIFAKGSLGTAMFVAVMYAGALPKGSKLIAPLMKIRGELSITAAILVLCHNFTYGMTYFRMLFTKTSLLSATQLAAAVISLVLTVTSFPSVRKKMQAKKWKQLQRTAYVFYGLMYVHIMLINIPYARLGLGMYIANVVIYSIVFLGYAAMRIAKAVSVKAARAGKAYGKKPETVLYGLALVICAVMTVLCFAGRQTVSASEDNEEWNDFFNEETVAAMVKEIESSTAKTDAEGTTQESLEESVSSDGQSDSQAGGVGNEVSGNSNNSGSDNVSGNSSGNSSDSGNQSAKPDNGSDNSGELSGGSGSDAPANTKFKADGTYTGSAVCETYNYNVTVTIVISGDTITSVTAESEASAQDVQYFNMANAKVPSQLLANQSTSGVDSVSGATKSSNAIKKAFYYAYKSAKK